MNPVEQAARNNAIWCDSVCRAHGVPGEFVAGGWVNRRASPAYYPNFIVVSAAQPEGETIRQVTELKQLGFAKKWAVKDSFRQLELASLGFEVLFEASWIGVGPDVLVGHTLPTDLHWERMTVPAELYAWESAWAGEARGSDPNGRPRQFPEALLADPEIAFLAGFQGDELKAGGIANRAAGAVGLSNVFVLSGQATTAWSGLMATAAAIFPGLPLVGYEGGAALETAEAGGFSRLGPLRVWGSLAAN